MTKSLNQKKKAIVILTSSKTMFMTMVILIIGFLFSSYLLFHHRTDTTNLRPPLANIKNTVTKQVITLGTNLWDFSEEKETKKPKEKKKKEVAEPLPFSLNKLISPPPPKENTKPLLKINGIGYLSRKNLGYVVINGTQYLEGKTKNKITIIKININKTIKIKHEGVTKIVHIGDNL
jgi:hypothetical protein